ncbi:MAG TPA: hypothetical protein VNO17_08965, partial [Actinomycetota bacterium]|nr:hypothetical protein [Actinomycetota bacterium]
ARAAARGAGCLPRAPGEGRLPPASGGTMGSWSAARRWAALAATGLGLAWALLLPHRADAAPRIALRVTAEPDSGSPGSRITFRYRVTNPGDEPLFDVVVTDAAVGAVGSVDRLRPGRTVAFVRQVVLRAAPIKNVAVARATDRQGIPVRSRAVATVTVVAGTPGGQPELAFTGAPALAEAGAAVLLLLAGAAFVGMGRRPT